MRESACPSGPTVSRRQREAAVESTCQDVGESSAFGRSQSTPATRVRARRVPLPNRLMTAFEVAEFIGCHEETVRRAYLRGLPGRTGSDASKEDRHGDNRYAIESEAAPSVGSTPARPRSRA